MRTIFLVQPTEAERARRMEQKLLSLPEESGILFVGVDVIQDPLEKMRRPLYRIFIGCTKDRDPSLMDLIAKSYLKDEVSDEKQLLVEAHRGLLKPALDKPDIKHT